MTLTVVLQRVGMSRVSYDAIPIAARVVQGGVVGSDLLEKTKPTDPETARREVKRILGDRFGCAVDVVFDDRTAERD